MFHFTKRRNWLDGYLSNKQVEKNANDETGRSDYEIAKMTKWISTTTWWRDLWKIKIWEKFSKQKLYKLMNHEEPRNEWIDLNFQLINTPRQALFEVYNNSIYKVGNNILINRLSCLNRKISLDLPFESYKIKCKSQFLF